MAIIFSDGFDYVDTVAFSDYIWDIASQIQTYRTGTETPFNYGKSADISSWGSSYAYKSYSNSQTIIHAFHWYCAGLGDGSTTWMRFYDGATVQMALKVNASNHVLS